MRSEEYYQRMSERKVPLKLGLMFGLVWAVAQFGISEVFHRVGQYTGSEVFFEVSDLVAWPAGYIYLDQEIKLYREELDRIEVTAEESEYWDSLQFLC